MSADTDATVTSAAEAIPLLCISGYRGMNNYRILRTKYRIQRLRRLYKISQHCFFLICQSQACHVSGSEHAQARNDLSPGREMYTPDEVLYHVSMPEWAIIYPTILALCMSCHLSLAIEKVPISVSRRLNSKFGCHDGTQPSAEYRPQAHSPRQQSRLFLPGYHCKGHS